MFAVRVVQLVLELTTGFDFVRLERTCQCGLVRILIMTQTLRMLTLYRPSDLYTPREHPNKILGANYKTKESVPSSLPIVGSSFPFLANSVRSTLYVWSASPAAIKRVEEGPTNSLRASPLLRCCWSEKPGKPPFGGC